MASHPILKIPDFRLPFLLACDASDKAIAACLFQVVNDLEHYICLISQKLNKHRLAYSTIEKEAFAQFARSSN